MKLVNRGGRGTKRHIHCVHYVASITCASSFFRLFCLLFFTFGEVGSRPVLMCRSAPVRSPLGLFGVFLSSLFPCNSAQRPRVLHAHTTQQSRTRAKSVSLRCVFCSDTRARYSPRAAAAVLDEKRRLLLLFLFSAYF